MTLGTRADRLRKWLAIPDDAFIVGGVGTTDWRKGPDLFVQLAAAVARSGSSGGRVHFVWIGGSAQGLEAEQLRHDARRAGVGDRVHLVGLQRDVEAFYAAFDVLALVSREDSFPLSCLEAAANGCPTICFEGAGGTPEFTGDDAGIVVPYLDLHAMATAVWRILGDGVLRQKLGDTAAARVRDWHDVTLAAPKLLEIMRRVQREGEHLE